MRNFREWHAVRVNNYGEKSYHAERGDDVDVIPVSCNTRKMASRKFSVRSNLLEASEKKAYFFN